MNVTLSCPTQKQALFSSLILNGLLTTICVAFGSVGNIFFIVKIKQKFQIGQSLRPQLIALSVWDCTVLFCAFAYYGLYFLLQLLIGHSVINYPIWIKMLVTFHFPFAVATTGAAWITVIIALNRYFAILRPFQSFSRRRSSNRSNLENIILVVAVILYCIPCLYELSLIKCQGIPGVSISPQLLRIPSYQLFYRTVCYMVFVSVGPFVLTLVTSVHSVFLLTRYRNRLQSNQNRSRSHRKISVLMTILLAKFLLTYILPTAIMVCQATVGLKMFGLRWAKFSDIANLCIILNSATNFLVYVIWEQTAVKKNPNDETAALLPIKNELLNKNEINVLHSTWQNGKHEGLFEELLIYLSHKYPSIETILENYEDKKNIGKKAFVYFDLLFDEMKKTQQFPIGKIRNIGKIHRQNGVRLTNSNLKDFKVYFLTAILGESDVELSLHNDTSQSLQLTVWNKFLSALISEIKLGYITSEPQFTAVTGRFGRRNAFSVASPFL